MIDEGWFGPQVTDAARSRLGDVALVAQGTVAFHDPDDTGPFELVGRHGSLTSAEMLVPLLGASRPDRRMMPAMSDPHARRRPAERPTDARGRSTPDRSSAGPAADGRPTSGRGAAEFVSEPAKVMRIGSMIKQLLDEVRTTELDEPGRERLKAIYDTSIDRARLGAVARPARRARPAGPARSTATTRPATSSCASPRPSWSGWLEGLFHGIQATLFAQQMAARQQLENMRGQLPPGAGPGGGGPDRGAPRHLPVGDRRPRAIGGHGRPVGGGRPERCGCRRRRSGGPARAGRRRAGSGR